MLGGIGYSYLSGLPLIVGDLVPTLEGENYVMYQQAARYLLKAAKAARSGQHVHPELAYLADPLKRQCPQTANFEDPRTQLRVYQHRAARMIIECDEEIRLSTLEQPAEAAWNTHMMDIIAAARAHLQLAVLDAFIRHVAQISDPAVQSVMKHLCDLYALSDIENQAASGSLGFVENGYISHAQMRDIRRIVRSKHDALIPEAVALVDAWNFSDASLQSAVGQKDGNVYERVMGWTRQLPMNKEAASAGGLDVQGFETHTRPLLGSTVRSRL